MFKLKLYWQCFFCNYKYVNKQIVYMKLPIDQLFSKMEKLFLRVPTNNRESSIQFPYRFFE